MVFSDLFFVFVFLALCMGCYFIIPNLKYKNAVLIIFSLLFYAWGEPTYIILLLLSTAVNYFAGLIIDKKRNTGLAKASIITAIVFNIGLLFVFKYTDFFIQNINPILGICFKCFNTAADCLANIANELVLNNVFSINIDLPDIAFSIPSPNIRLPIGISFFTFQIMSYIIDCYWEKVDVQKSYFKLLLYIALFPQLVAGPIVRYSTIEKEIDNRKTTLKDFSEGITRFIVGLSKKVIIANGLYEVVTNLFGEYTSEVTSLGSKLTELSFIGTVVGIICFALYVYFDFSGYSDMAIGIGRIFGFHFDENFLHPFASKNISEFWQRWHISLGSFFRDYLLYVPIFGKRRKYLSLFLVWFCTGFWHGASWNFILWGLYFGTFILIEMLIGKKRMKKIPAPISHVYSLLVIAIGFGIFYFENLKDLFNFFKNLIFANGNAFIDPSSKATILNSIFLIIIAAIISMPILPKIKKMKWLKESKKGEIITVCFTTVTNILLLVLSIIMLTDNANNPFLYFRF